MSDLITKLRAAIDEDERIAKSASNKCGCHEPTRVLAMVAAHREILEVHYKIWRDIGWLEDGDEESAELAVCEHCVPRHSSFGSRAELPSYPCATVRTLAKGYGIEP